MSNKVSTFVEDKIIEPVSEVYERGKEYVKETDDAAKTYVQKQNQKAKELAKKIACTSKKFVQNAWDDVKSAAEGVKNWVSEHKEVLVAVGTCVAVVGLAAFTVCTFGAGACVAGVVAGAAIGGAVGFEADVGGQMIANGTHNSEWRGDRDNTVPSVLFAGQGLDRSGRPKSRRHPCAPR